MSTQALLDDVSSQRASHTSHKWLAAPILIGTALLVFLAPRFERRAVVGLEAQNHAMACSAGWNGTWSFTPARSFFAGNLTVLQVGCHVTVEWWEFAVDWPCRGQWLSGWIQIRSEYTAHNQEIIPWFQMDGDEQHRPNCWGTESWRPANMTLSADATRATGSDELWIQVPPVSPTPSMPSCLSLNECSIGFADGFLPCCDGLVLQQDYSNTCHHAVGKLGYPEVGLSCQKWSCLEMGSDCYNHRNGCCPGLNCQDIGISGYMCA